MKVYITYETDGYNNQCVDKVFDSWRKAANYEILRYYRNSRNDGLSQEELDSSVKAFIHEFEIE